MGKTGGSSWLTVVKRAFRSPTKENEKRSSRRREENEQEEEEKVKKKKMMSLTLRSLPYKLVLGNISPWFILQHCTKICLSGLFSKLSSGFREGLGKKKKGFREEKNIYFTSNGNPRNSLSLETTRLKEIYFPFVSI